MPRSYPPIFMGMQPGAFNPFAMHQAFASGVPRPIQYQQRGRQRSRSADEEEAENTTSRRDRKLERAFFESQRQRAMQQYASKYQQPVAGPQFPQPPQAGYAGINPQTTGLADFAMMNMLGTQPPQMPVTESRRAYGAPDYQRSQPPVGPPPQAFDQSLFGLDLGNLPRNESAMAYGEWVARMMGVPQPSQSGRGF